MDVYYFAGGYWVYKSKFKCQPKAAIRPLTIQRRKFKQIKQKLRIMISEIDKTFLSQDFMLYNLRTTIGR